jgi:hypothetical protein
MSDGEGFMLFTGIAFVVIGIFLLISGITTPAVSQSKTGMLIAVVLLLGGIIATTGIPLIWASDYSMPVLIGGMALIILPCLCWPCVCVQGSRAIRSQIIGVASAHERITISELSRISGATIKATSEIVYDAIGKRELSGRMEGDTFVRSAPTSTTYAAPSSTTKEREIVKVLVICPYCGAKTEQGIGKCQNCQADL